MKQITSWLRKLPPRTLFVYSNWVSIGPAYSVYGNNIHKDREFRVSGGDSFQEQKLAKRKSLELYKAWSKRGKLNIVAVLRCFLVIKRQLKQLKMDQQIYHYRKL